MALAVASQPIQPIPANVPIRPRRRSKIGAAVTVTVVALAERQASAQLRLRGDALVQTRSPVGLLVLRGEDQVQPWLDAETVTWLGTHTGGDVLTLSVRARHARSGSEARLGRQIVTMGAVRPVHVDGVRGLVRPYRDTTLEAFAGVPVVTGFGWKEFMWTAGGRAGASLGERGTLGLSYAVRRPRSGLDQEEAGADLAITPARWLTAAARASFDLVTEGIADALASVSAQKDDVRVELFVTHREPSRLLPRTSLFSVLGDVPATTAGPTARWRAFPRLELVGSGSVQTQGGAVGGQGFGRASLALDDAWAGTIGLEARRVDFNGARWIGLRALASVPLTQAFRAATELELVRPDEPGTRPSLWPWALASIAWSSPSGWEVASGVEASSGATERASLHALARVSYAFDRAPPPGGRR
ncbi:MAG: hypothetical protein KIT84_16125 [Labilithrix sp.]|nr:hypothetical protein [Labilithrix sp.]MCW5812556.1 hypothetical protein [Labilithrix sp.]